MDSRFLVQIVLFSSVFRSSMHDCVAAIEKLLHRYVRSRHE